MAITRLPGFDSQRLPRFFSSAKTSLLGSRWGDGICGALVQFGCYQHRYLLCIDDTCGALVQFGCYHHSVKDIRPHPEIKL